MKKKYKKLGLREREKLAVGLAKGKSLRQIARELGRSHSTLSREITYHHISGKIETYSPSASNDIASIFRRRAGRKKSIKNEFIRKYVEGKIKEGLSPEQVSGRLSVEYPEYRVSHETIYQYIYNKADYLTSYLARRHPYRKKKKNCRKFKRSKIPNRISIDIRPEAINKRSEFGHWESDSIVSSHSKPSLNVLVERKSRVVFITKIDDQCSMSTYEAICNRLTSLPSQATPKQDKALHMIMDLKMLYTRR